MHTLRTTFCPLLSEAARTCPSGLLLFVVIGGGVGLSCGVCVHRPQVILQVCCVVLPVGGKARLTKRGQVNNRQAGINAYGFLFRLLSLSLCCVYLFVKCVLYDPHAQLFHAP